jgi:hypothetical protein
VEVEVDVDGRVREVRIERARVVQDETVGVQVEDMLIERKVLVEDRAMALVKEFRWRHVGKNVQMLRKSERERRERETER